MAPQEQQGLVSYVTNAIAYNDASEIFNYEFN